MPDNVTGFKSKFVDVIYFLAKLPGTLTKNSIKISAKDLMLKTTCCMLSLYLGAATSLLTSAAPPEPATDAVIALGNMSEDRIEYELAATRLALEKSRDPYGDYRLSIDRQPYSYSRLLRMLQLGNEINMISAPVTAGHRQAPLKIVKVPLLRGMLGKRLLIVRREDLADFERITQLSQLRAYTAGLGFDWTDLLFFDHNRLPYSTGSDITQLFTMLQRKRFDYLPLGQIEARSALANSGLGEQLALVKGVMIQYPQPVYLQVSANRPDLAQRLEYGLSRAQADGSLQQLFEQHYSHLTEQSKSARIITLQDLPTDPGSDR